MKQFYHISRAQFYKRITDILFGIASAAIVILLILSIMGCTTLKESDPGLTNQPQYTPISPPSQSDILRALGVYFEAVYNNGVMLRK